MEPEACQHLLDSLSDYVDGELRTDLCAQLERHLENCTNCKIVVDSLRKTVYLYQVTAEEPAVPDQVRQRLYRCLDLDEFLKQG